VWIFYFWEGYSMEKRSVVKRLPILVCSFCGTEIGRGEQYWYISGAVVCEACLPEFARQDYRCCRCVRGEEAAR
jgi:predicted amidophosphoribosyltransferase